MQACLALRKQKPDLKILLSVGSTKYHSQAFQWATGEAFRKDFANSLRSLVMRLGLNGVDG
ncbi:MAG: glycosyl hydrolase family 18 protein [Janthinobacterium lividum]